ncbi:MAG: DegV family protein [Chloroflexota bacterium]
MHHNIALVTDSTCDIPPALLHRYHITVVPLYILWGDEELLDGRDIDNATFYARLPQDPAHPQTSQPTPTDFVRVIEQLDAEQVLIIALSAALSGTCDSALQARDVVDRPVHVVDSRSLSMGLGWQVLAAARERERGGDVDAMIAAAERIRGCLSVLLTVETLEYLHRGGRIGSAARLLGSVVQLKPVLEVDHATGVLEVVSKIRTRKRALREILEETFRRLDATRPLRAAVLHGAAEEDAHMLAEEIRKRADPLELIMTQITPVLGVHGGPGVVGLAAYND